MKPVLPVVLASLLHDDFIKQQPLRGKYKVAELSGGNGELSYNTLHIIRALAHKKISSYAELYEKIDYHVYEISNNLAVLQRQKNKIHIREGKLTILNRSALEINQEYKFVFMNELWDVLPFEQVEVCADGQIKVKVLLPKINKSYYKKIFRKQANTYRQPSAWILTCRI